jgi:hypothetical protein
MKIENPDNITSFNQWVRSATKDFRSYGIDDLQDAFDKPFLYAVHLNDSKTQLLAGGKVTKLRLANS